MSRNLIILMILVVAIFVFGCNDKAPACSTLSWGETKVEEPGFDLKYSAGDQCENINDYWDIDIESIISKIQKMKFVKNDVCKKQNTDGEYIEYQCPEFIPETIEFGEVSGCKFGTPPSEKEDCLAGPLIILFSSSSNFKSISWTFNVENPQFYLGSESQEGAFDIIGSNQDGKIMTGQFSDDTLTNFIMKFKWTETVEGVETKKKMSLDYSVEVKE